MYGHKSVLGLICARGGSTGLPGKNIMDFCGKPMIGWAIEKLLALDIVDRVVVDTESMDIAKVARDFGAEIPFVRDTKLAGNDTPMLPVIRDCLKRLRPDKYDIMILAQANSPLSRREDMHAGLCKLVDENLDVVFSVTQCTHPPQWMLKLAGDTPEYAFPGHALDRPACRQENEPLYRTTGAFSCATTRHVIEGDHVQLCLPAPGQKSGVIITDFASGVDIDTIYDYVIARSLCAQIG